MSPKKVISKILSIILIIILIIAIAISVKVLIQSILFPDEVPSIFGWKIFFIVSDNMDPEIKSGDLIFTKEVDPNTLKIGDIIAYKTDEKFITIEKIEDIKENGKEFIVRSNFEGVASNSVSPSKIEGVIRKRIPNLGRIAIELQKPRGIVTLISIPLFIIILTLVLDAIIDDENKKKKAAN